MRVGVIGTGRIGATHAAVIASTPGVTGLMITDVIPSRARELADRLGATVAGTPQALIDDGAEALVITAPTDVHAELVMLGVRAGLPVFCEKPVAADLANTHDIATVVAATGAVVQVGFQRRFDAGYRAARDAVAAGKLGELHRVHMMTADPAPPPAAYIPRSGGIFRDCHIHDFDMIRWVTGHEVVAVTAIGSNLGADYFAEAGDVDTSVALLELSGGVLATMQGSRYNGAGYDVRMELAGTADSWAVGLDGRTPLHDPEGGLQHTGERWAGFAERFADAYAAEITAFVGLAAGRGSNACTVDDAFQALVVAEAADASRRQGRRVTTDEIRSSVATG